MSQTSSKTIRPEHESPAGFKSARELIADALRERILSGALTGGEPLRQDRIAKQFGVSAIPVREALRELGGEGLVDFAPRRGAMVSMLSRDEVVEVCEMREALEVLALDKALSRMQPADLRRAGDVLRGADAENDAELLAAWGRVNWQFHSALYAPSQRPQLLRVIQNLHNQFDRYLRIHFSALDYRRKGQDEHWALLALCEKGDTAGALAALREHIRTASAMLVDYIDREAGQSDAG